MVDKDQLSPNLVQPAVDIRSKREGGRSLTETVHERQQPRVHFPHNLCDAGALQFIYFFSPLFPEKK